MADGSTTGVESLCCVLQYNMMSPTQLVDAIVDRVTTKLKDLGRVPRDHVRGARPVAWTLSRTTTALVGREAEVEDVLGSLRQHGAAVIWGGPGEGKSTVAREAAARLHAKQPTLGAFELDMRGEPAGEDCQRCLLMFPRNHDRNWPLCVCRHGCVLGQFTGVMCRSECSACNGRQCSPGRGAEPLPGACCSSAGAMVQTKPGACDASILAEGVWSDGSSQLPDRS